MTFTAIRRGAADTAAQTRRADKLVEVVHRHSDVAHKVWPPNLAVHELRRERQHVFDTKLFRFAAPDLAALDNPRHDNALGSNSAKDTRHNVAMERALGERRAHCSIQRRLLHIQRRMQRPVPVSYTHLTLPTITAV